jgi:ABC-type multidrug transport system fused ATPase/permease subunit
LIVAHRLSTIQHADKIIVLDSGRLAESGTLTQLLAAGGLFSRFYGFNFEISAQGGSCAPI